MKLEFNSVEELTEFYKKYIEKEEIKVPIEKVEPKRDLVLQTQENNKMSFSDLKKILK